jgi:2-aminoadipate transaminase
VLARFEQWEGVAARDLNLGPDDVVITTGSQQMLYLLSEALLDEGDIVINGAPSYFVYSGLLEVFGVQVRSVVEDEGGMSVDGLSALLERLKAEGDLPRVKLIYIVDYFSNPTGVSLAADRRPRIVELAERCSIDHRIIVFEDAAYRELRYDGPDLPSLKRYDPKNRTVAFTTTFSKPFSPGMKTGWTILPGDLLGPVLRIKGNHDFGSSNFNQHLLDRVIADGSYDGQVTRLREAYRTKRDVMLAALEQHFGRFAGGRCRWIKPAGGLYVWFELPAGMQTGLKSRLFTAAVEEGVLYTPGEFAYTPQPGLTVPRNCVRLSFGVASTQEIREGVSRLARAAARVGVHPA